MPEYIAKVVLTVAFRAESDETAESELIVRMNREALGTSWGLSKECITVDEFEAVIAGSIKEVCSECGNDPATPECWMEHYPYMVAWYRRTGCFDYYIETRVREALATKAPRKALFPDHGEWATVDRLDPEVRKEIEQAAEKLPPRNG